MSGTLFVVATPIGNLEDLSARAVRILSQVAIIAAEDTRRTGHLLARYGIQTPATSLNEHNETGKGTQLISRLLAGDSVALVSDAGTPTVSDPGERLVTLAIEAGIRVEPIPGASAPLALLSVSGLPSESFTFLGFPPVKAEDRKRWFEGLGREPRTVVFFEAPHRLAATLTAIRTYFGECHIVVGRELTKVHEEVFRGGISEAIKAFEDPLGEFVIAINLVGSQNTARLVEVTDAQILAAFAETRLKPGASKRSAAQSVARTLGVSPNHVYEVVERAKKSVV